MHERLKKYYNGRTCGIDLGRGSAIAAFAGLLEGETFGGDLFRMNTDEFMHEHLHPDDFEYWMQEKRKAMPN